jgi:hypothetical protein
MNKMTDLFSLLALGATVSPARILAAQRRVQHPAGPRGEMTTASAPALTRGRHRPRRLPLGKPAPATSVGRGSSPQGSTRSRASST